MTPLFDVLSGILAIGIFILGLAIGWQRGLRRGVQRGVRAGVDAGREAGIRDTVQQVTDQCTEITHRLLERLGVSPAEMYAAACELEAEDGDGGKWGGAITVADLERIYRKA